MIIEKKKKKRVGIKKKKGLYGNEEGLKEIKIFEGGNVKLKKISRKEIQVEVKKVYYKYDR